MLRAFEHKLDHSVFLFLVFFLVYVLGHDPLSEVLSLHETQEWLKDHQSLH